MSALLQRSLIVLDHGFITDVALLGGVYLIARRVRSMGFGERASEDVILRLACQRSTWRRIHRWYMSARPTGFLSAYNARISSPSCTPSPSSPAMPAGLSLIDDPHSSPPSPSSLSLSAVIISCFLS